MGEYGEDVYEHGDGNKAFWGSMWISLHCAVEINLSSEYVCMLQLFHPIHCWPFSGSMLGQSINHFPQPSLMLSLKPLGDRRL